MNEQRGERVWWVIGHVGLARLAGKIGGVFRWPLASVGGGGVESRKTVDALPGIRETMDQMTTAEAAEYLGTPVATMRWWRHEDRGPISYRLGRRVVYARADLDRWRDDQRAATARGDGAKVRV